MRVPIPNLGEGANKDQLPEEVALGVWSNSYNVRVRVGSAERFNGIEAIYPVSFVPYGLHLFDSSTTRFGVAVGLSAVAAHDGTTESSITGVWPAGTADDKITGGPYQGSLILNNGAGDPVYWNGNTASTCAALTGWPAGWKAKSVRPFGDYIFALNLYRSSTWEPHSYAWSDVGQPGGLPTDWTAADDNQAGDNFVVSSGRIVDGIAHGEAFYIFKDTSVWEIRWIGGNAVFSRAKVGGSGMLAANCGVSTPRGMVVLTPGDVVVHNGLQEQSIANGRVRDSIFRRMNRERYERCFVTMNPSKSEVLICFPTTGRDWPDVAEVWNWEENTWSTRRLPSVTCGAYGQIAAPTDSDDWEDRVTDWPGAGLDVWLTQRYGENDARLVLGTYASGIGLFDQGDTDFGVALSNQFELRGLHLGDPERVKLLKHIHLTVDAPDGTTLNVQGGGSLLPDTYPIWRPVKRFVKGSSQRVNVFARGRYLAVRVGSAGGAGWRVRSGALDVEPLGLFG